MKTRAGTENKRREARAGFFCVARRDSQKHWLERERKEGDFRCLKAIYVIIGNKWG